MRQDFDPVDFRLLATIPSLVGWTMILVPALMRGRFIGWLLGFAGAVGVGTWFLCAFILLRYCQLAYLPLVRLYHQDLVAQLDEWLAVELEDASTYDRFKLLPDDLGVIYMDGDTLRMRTNTRDLDITGALDPEAVANVASNEKLKAAILHLPGGDVVAKPIYPGWDPRMHGSPQAKIAWMRSTLLRWTARSR
jgi:hypothetical protein